MRDITLPEPDKPIDIYYGGLRLICENTGAEPITIIGIGSIKFNWLPEPGISFELSQVKELVKDSMNSLVVKNRLFEWISRIESIEPLPLPDKKVLSNIRFTGFEGHTSYVKLRGTPTRRVSVNYEIERTCNRLRLYLVNLNIPPFQARDGEWDLCLRSLEGYEKLGELKNEGTEYVVTHYFEARRNDGSDITVEDVEHLTEAWGKLFSFIRGGWCHPICFTGYKLIENSLAWAEWNKPIISPLVDPLENWCHYETDFRPMFTKMVEYIKDDFWVEVISLAIEWYIKANRYNINEIKEQIIFCQTALELLAWAYMVEYKKCFSVNGFNKLSSTSERLRVLLIELRIGAGMPLGIPDLLQFCGNADGPKALTEIRNAIVHPRKAKREQLSGISDIAMYQALKLGLWYLELILLRLLGYNGYYYNRLTYGYREVPWGASPL